MNRKDRGQGVIVRFQGLIGSKSLIFGSRRYEPSWQWFKVKFFPSWLRVILLAISVVSIIVPALVANDVDRCADAGKSGYNPGNSTNANGHCSLYPIALSEQSVSNIAPGTVIDILNGTQPGNFGWLSWGGSPSEPTLVASLTPPGDSWSYVNPDDSLDHQISIGDWVSGKPGVSNSKQVRDALELLKTVDITVPVWSEARGQGSKAAYLICGFAQVRVLDYRLPGQNRITVRFLGYVNCGQQNQGPTVNAGADQTIVLSAHAQLSGVVSDDGLPVGSVVTSVWSQVSGPGVVTFADPTVPVTTATFSAPGVYVLRLTATDSELTASDDVVITVNRGNHPPVAENQNVTTDEDVPLSITLTGSDSDGDPLTFVIVDAPACGALSGTLPHITYTPKPDYHGSDYFTFKVNDGELDSGLATVTDHHSAGQRCACG
jgi:hypothetical protein